MPRPLPLTAAERFRSERIILFERPDFQPARNSGANVFDNYNCPTATRNTTMLDLLINDHGKCGKCGREGECVRVWFWDKTFSGLICWLDLMKMVREKSQDPEARKKFAAMRRKNENSMDRTTIESESISEWNSEGVSHTEGISHGKSEQIPSNQGIGITHGKSISRTIARGESKNRQE
jgi:hypothetical protein